jgi:hypothetical protein
MPQEATAPIHGMSLAAWASLPEDAPGELVYERLVEEEAPDAVHETIVRRLLVALSTWIVPRGGLSFGSELGDNGRYQHALGASDGLLASIPGCDGLTLDLDAMWAELERLGMAEEDEDLPFPKA